MENVLLLSFLAVAVAYIGYLVYSSRSDSSETSTGTGGGGSPSDSPDNATIQFR